MKNKFLQPSGLLFILGAFSLLYFSGNKFDTSSSLYGAVTVLGVIIFLALPGAVKTLFIRSAAHKPRIFLVSLSLLLAFWVTLSFFTSQAKNVGYGEVIMMWVGTLIFITPKTWWNSRLLVIGGITLLITSSLSGLFLYFSSLHQRLFGLFFDPAIHTDAWPNAFALFVLMLWPLILFWKPRIMMLKIFRTLVLSIVVAALICSFSRAGIAVFILQVIALSFFTWFQARKSDALKNFRWYGEKIAYIGVVFVISLVFIAGTLFIRHDFFHQPTPFIADKIKFANGEEITSVQERVDFWKGSLLLLAQQPLFGYGPMSFGYVYRNVQSDWLEISDHPHNLFLKLGVESGLPAALLMMTIVVLLFIRTVKNWRYLDQQKKYQLLVLWIAFAGGLLHNQVDYNLNFITNALIWWLLLAAIDISSSHEVKKTVSGPSWNIILTSVGIIGALSFASLSVYPFFSHFFTGKSYPLENKIFFSRYAFLIEGDRFRDQNNLNLAMFYYRLHIEKNPLDATGYTRLGELFRSQKNYAQALIYFQDALNRDHKNLWIHYRNYVEALVATHQNDTLLAFSPELIKEIEQYMPKIKANLHYTAQKADPKDLLALLKIMQGIDEAHSRQYQEFGKIVLQSIEKYRI